jgi:hypothetical protein
MLSKRTSGKGAGDQRHNWYDTKAPGNWVGLKYLQAGD